MRERFSTTELTALRNDLLQGGLADSREAAELVRVFLMGRGCGVSPAAERYAVGRVEIAGCTLPVVQKAVENLARVGRAASTARGEFTNFRGPRGRRRSP